MLANTSTNFFSNGAQLDVHLEDGHWWATCPGCPGFSAAADSWDELFRLVAEFHASADAKHRDWLMLKPFSWTGPWVQGEP